MRSVSSYSALEMLGRVRLSRHFYFRDFLYSDIANYYGIPNIPDNPDLAIETGTRLATDLLDPLVDTFGPITLRSSYRSPAVNDLGNRKGHNCASNDANFASHIWDYPDSEGRIGATACISIPWFANQFENGRDWRDLAWWIADHLPYSSMFFFPRLAAMNLTWSDRPKRQISSYIAPKGILLRSGKDPGEDIAKRQERYRDFPAFNRFRGVFCRTISRRRTTPAALGSRDCRPWGGAGRGTARGGKPPSRQCRTGRSARH